MLKVRIFIVCALVLASLPASAGVISVSRSDVYNADPSLNDGDTTSQATIGGVDFTFDYVTANNFLFDGTTSFGPLPAETLFGATSTNVFGSYDRGFGGVNPYFTVQESVGSIIGARLTEAAGGSEAVTISGSLAPWTSTVFAGGTIDIAWALIEFDALSGTYFQLDSGAVTGTSTGHLNNIMSMSGDTAVSGSASLQSGDWVGMFFQKTGSTGSFSGSHFNINDAGIDYSLNVAMVPEPPAIVLLLLATAGMLARRSNAQAV